MNFNKDQLLNSYRFNLRYAHDLVSDLEEEQLYQTPRPGLEKIGARGMGEVYFAEDTQLERRIALKFLPTNLGVNPEMRKRFVRGAHAAGCLITQTSPRSTK